MWGEALSSSLRCTHVAGTTEARRRHEARHLSLCRGGGACLVAPVVALPTLRSHPRWSPRWGLHGVSSLRARSCGPSRTPSLLPPHPAALSSGGGRFSPPPYLHPPLLGGRRCVWGGEALSSSLRCTHVAGTTQAWRRHEAPHLSLCRGGGLRCVTRRRPSYPACAPGGRGRRCVGGEGRPCRRPLVARMSQARRRVGFRTRTAHGTTHGNYPLPCPLCSLPRSLCSLGAEQSPCLPRRSLPLLRLSGLRSPPKCPTSFALPAPSSLVLAGPRCMTLRRHTAHCTFGGGLLCGSTPRHPALPSAPVRCGRLARVWGTLLPPSLLCHL